MKSSGGASVPPRPRYEWQSTQVLLTNSTLPFAGSPIARGGSGAPTCPGGTPAAAGAATVVVSRVVWPMAPADQTCRRSESGGPEYEHRRQRVRPGRGDRPARRDGLTRAP